MRERRQLVSFLFLMFVLILTGCGGGQSAAPSPTPTPIPTPSPTPSPTPVPTPTPLVASEADLNGTYAISLVGNNPGTAGGFFGIIGSMHANGSGIIDSGALGIEVDGNPATHLHQVNLSGTYAINPNALGAASLNTVLGPVILEFVMISKSHGLVTRFESGAGTATGTIDLQTPADFSLAALENSSFVFNLLSTDATKPRGLAGTFTTDATGNFSSGIVDINDNGTVSANNPMSGGFVLAPDSNGFGFISIQYRLPNNLITGLQLDYIIVDRTHLKVLESEGVGFAAGDAFTQSSINVAVPNTALAGPFALTLQGPNNFALGAVLVATPTSGSTSDGTISGTGDLNASTPASNAAVTGTYTMTGSGRGTMTLSVGALSRQFAVYPSTGGVQMFETDALDLVNGIAVQQSPGPFSSASIDGYFGAVLASRNSAGAVSGIFHFTSTSASVTGEDFFISSAGTTSKGSGFFPGSSIVVNSNGRAAVSLPFSANTSNTAHFVIYLVDPTKMLFIQTDAGQAGRGIIQQQLQSQL